MVASVGLGKSTARSFLASTTNRCAASKVLVAWTSTLCRLPSGSVTVTVHQRIDFKASTDGEQKAKLSLWKAVSIGPYRALRDWRLFLISVIRPGVFLVG